MIQRAIFFSSLLALVSMLALFSFLFFPTLSDREHYAKILEKRQRLISSGNSPLESIHQMRDGVQKDLWITSDKIADDLVQKDQERLHFRIHSENSDLIFHRFKKRIEVVENLHNIQCWIQEKILRDENRQLVRFFSSQEGTYRYPSHLFSAPHLFLSFFQLPGTDLPEDLSQETPFLQGVADKVCFRFTEKLPGFEATRLRAIYHLNKELMP